MDFKSSRLGILPLGTANVLATELGIGTDIKKAIDRISAGHQISWDVGIANHKKFVVFSGAAFDAAVTGTLSKKRKGNITYLTYIIPTIKTYANWKSPQIKVSIDGKEIEGFASQVIISNVNHFAGFFALSPEICPGDGLLDVFVFRSKGRRALIKYFAAMFFRILPSFKSVEQYKGKEITLESEQKDVPYQLDGDLAGTLPLRISVLPGALKIMV